MAFFRIVRRTPLAPADAWQRLTDWERHADHVPLTRITVTTTGPSGVGTTFVARTGAGRVAFEDPMEVVRWEPPAAGRPGHCRLEKRGRVVTGWTELEVRAHRAGSLAVWQEELAVPKLPRLFDAPASWSGRLIFGRVLTELLTG